MSSPLYEIAADALAMPGILCEWGYWSTRATWGLSERDIINGTLASASLGAIALYSYAHPEARAPGGMASVFFMTPLERLTAWIFRQERAFYMARVIVLAITIFYVGYTLITSAPNVFGQSRQVQMQDNTRELATHGAAIDSLSQWRRDMEAANLPGRLMVMERNVAEMKDDQKYLARLLYGSLATGLIWLVQQALALLRKGSKAD